MKTLRKLSKQVESTLAAAGVIEAAGDAKLLIMHAFDLSPIDYALGEIENAGEDDYAALWQLVEKRKSRMPMSQIFGEKEFWSLTFKVTPDTLTPRPDSETLIEETLRIIEDHTLPLTILDLGTGTGCLLLSLLSELPNASGVGVDISAAALEVARENAKNLDLSDRAKFINSNWTNKLEGSRKFDLIISNPPYIGLDEMADLSPEVRDHEPEAALFSGTKGLDDYKKLATLVAGHLNPKGRLILEIGFDQAEAVKKIFISVGFNMVSLAQDLGARDRCLIFEKRS